MSKTAKVVVSAIVIVVVFGAVWFWLMSQNPVSAPSATTGTNPAGPTAAAPGPSGLSSGNSNTNLNQDLATIDSQLNGLSSDAASINQGLNDQPVSQTQL